MNKILGIDNSILFRSFLERVEFKNQIGKINIIRRKKDFPLDDNVPQQEELFSLFFNNLKEYDEMVLRAKKVAIAFSARVYVSFNFKDINLIQDHISLNNSFNKLKNESYRGLISQSFSYELQYKNSLIDCDSEEEFLRAMSLLKEEDLLRNQRIKDEDIFIFNTYQGKHVLIKGRIDRETMFKELGKNKNERNSDSLFLFGPGILNNFINKPFDKSKDFFENNGINYRITSIDYSPMIVTCDLKPHRVNVDIVKGFIRKITTG